MDDIAVLKLTEAEANDMVKDVSDKEIKDALFDIDSTKVVDPDGKILWEINATLIALVPKMNTPNKVSNFKPIACCNVLYKCIRKILTNRIKGGLSKVVILNQSAFIPGRHIQNNILITQELLKGYNRTNEPKRCAMKIDIQKAYGGRGLKQGDHISLYLFTMVMEVFNTIMIKNIREDGSFKYHHGCKYIKLTHMCFSDDLMVLCNGDTDSLKVVKKSLDEFGSVSGLFPNLIKSTIFFGSINEKVKDDMLEILPFKCGKLPMRYLGVPLLAKSLGVKDCQNLLDSVENIINCWRNKFLSYAGRIQLIASILSAMQQYWASVYILPLTVINELEKFFKRFLWNPGGSVKGKARVAWKFVCRPKGQGGLGFKPLQRWNKVLLVSQLWKLIDKMESLWVKWVNTVKLKGKSIWEGESTNNDSHGPLDRFIQSRDIYDTMMSNYDCLADAISDGRWKWADEGSSRYLVLNQVAVPSLSMEKDRAQWLCEGNKAMNYSTKAAWLTMRDNWPKVDLCKVVWYSQCSPKQAIILWMAI
ncbi:RNA-directed DNA polymerase, eukaryota, reverse transcriptase zinc-binding domain protein [Tanacetum coccineum]